MSHENKCIVGKIQPSMAADGHLKDYALDSRFESEIFLNSKISGCYDV